MIIVLIPVIDEIFKGSQKTQVGNSGPIVEVKNGEIRMIFEDAGGLSSVQTLSYTINRNTDYSPIEKPQRDIIYSIVDPLPKETKYFSMVATFADGSSTIIYDRELPPQ